MLNLSYLNTLVIFYFVVVILLLCRYLH